MNLYDINGNVVFNDNSVFPLIGKNVLFIGDSLTTELTGEDAETGGWITAEKDMNGFDDILPT